MISFFRNRSSSNTSSPLVTPSPVNPSEVKINVVGPWSAVPGSQGPCDSPQMIYEEPGYDDYDYAHECTSSSKIKGFVCGFESVWDILAHYLVFVYTVRPACIKFS